MTVLDKEKVTSSVTTMVVLAAVVLAAAIGFIVPSPTLLSEAFGLVIILVLVALCFRRPELAAVLVLPFLVVLGLLRRLLFSAGAATGADPLLLVAPIGVALLALVAARRGGFSGTSTLHRSVLALAALIVVGTLNPQQGGLQVGLGGILFLLVPVLWYFIGRSLLGERQRRQILRTIIGLGSLSAVYGLIQTYQGLPAFDSAYLESKPDYVALQVFGAIRAFGPFSAASEYGAYVGCTIVILVAVMRVRHAPWAVPLLAMLGWALLLESSRGITVLAVVAVASVTTIRLRANVAVAIVVATLSLVGLSAVASNLASSEVGGAATSGLLRHQFEGLGDPLSEDSTLEIHSDQALFGLGNAIRHPIGLGSGSVTPTATRFGGLASGTEADFSNVATALGLPGFLAFAVITIAGFRSAFRLARRDRDWVALAALGILIVTFFQWLNGGQYAAAPLPWMALGWIEARLRQLPKDGRD
jgi:hypothetical protein